ncbi:MAG: TetR family transcriptional regulator C-terminal domain-containing protein [Geminicoccaceae bacterium]
MTRRSFHHEPEEVRRRALIDATLDAVADLGLAGATVREIAARASVTPGLIRRYFLSKDRLVETAYTAFVDEMTAAFRGQAGDGKPLQRLQQVVRASCTEPVASSRHIAIWAAFVGVAHVDASMARVHREGYRAFRLLLEEIIRDLWVERGVSPDPAMVSRQSIAANAVIDGIWLEVSLERATFADLDIEALALESILALLRLPDLEDDHP